MAPRECHQGLPIAPTFVLILRRTTTTLSDPEEEEYPDYLALEEEQDCKVMAMNETDDYLEDSEASEESNLKVIYEAESSMASCSRGSNSLPGHQGDSLIRIAVSSEEEITFPPDTALGQQISFACCSSYFKPTTFHLITLLCSSKFHCSFE